MLQLSGAGKRFGHKLLFEQLDWLITPKERTGLVGGLGMTPEDAAQKRREFEQQQAERQAAKLAAMQKKEGEA